MALKLFSRTRSKQPQPRSVERPVQSKTLSASSVVDFEPAARETWDTDPLACLLQQGRYAIILQDESKWKAQPGGRTALEEAGRQLERRMALVPAGNVTIAQTLSAEPGAPERDAEVGPFLLGVHTVTNARYQQFVDAGGYDELDYWPEEIWPHLIEFKDLTDEPGPRFWRHGRHNAKLADHPIVGVSWYEAQAFALWIGQRLATEEEWQMAASWHINSSADLLRRFPWGDAMDNGRCNIWSSRNNRTVAVTEYPKGAAPNRVYQLVGNIWEWTDTEYSTTDDDGRPIVGEMPMHVVRGGAFDTFFECQATSHFRTGHIALCRTYNTGFRCALDLAAATWIGGG